MRSTVSSRSKTRTEGAMLVKTRSVKRHNGMLTKRMEHLKKEVNQATAVMDAETGKILNYKQLMRDPKYKKKWSTSSANEFGRLANGVGRRTKNN